MIPHDVNTWYTENLQSQVGSSRACPGSRLPPVPLPSKSSRLPHSQVLIHLPAGHTLQETSLSGELILLFLCSNSCTSLRLQTACGNVSSYPPPVDNSFINWNSQHLSSNVHIHSRYAELFARLNEFTTLTPFTIEKGLQIKV